MSILLYESYALGEQVLGPARVKDTEKTLTITLAAGKGVIVTAEAQLPGTTTVVTKLAAGAKFDLHIRVRNDGDRDTIWFTAKDKDTGKLITDWSGVLDPGKYIDGVSLNQVMPNKSYNILVEAGHGI